MPQPHPVLKNPPPLADHRVDGGGGRVRSGDGRRERTARARTPAHQQTREQHPRIGGLLLATQSPPQSEAAWETGATGEEILGAYLTKRCPNAIILHDRRIPGSRANIDHLAITASGVYLIDAKRYRGKIEVRSPLLGEQSLRIAGRDRSKLVASLERQVNQVRSTLDPLVPEMPIFGCFCFLNPAAQSGGSGLPLIRTLSVNGLPLYYPRRLAKRLNQDGALSEASRREVAGFLAAGLPVA